MLKRIKIRNYKSLIMNNDLELNNLTIISGINNIGKTTLLKTILDIYDYKNNNNSDILLSPVFFPPLTSFQTKVNNNDLSKKIEFNFKTSNTNDIDSEIKIEYYFDVDLKEGQLCYLKIENFIEDKLDSSLEISRKSVEDKFNVKAFNFLSPYYVRIKPDMIKKIPINFEGIADFIFIKSLPLEGYFYLKDNPILYEYFELEENIDKVTFGVSKKVEKIVKNISYIKYLEPLRSHPREYYHLLGGQNIMSSNGDNAIDILVKFRDKKVSYFRKLKDKELKHETLNEGLNYWFKYFFNEVDFNIKHVVDDVLIQILINGFSINNSGFGISQILPIIIQGLLLEENELFVLEQPEIHLHPELEMKLATFLLCLAKNNRQIIAETHSEHIINQIILEKMDIPEIESLYKIYFLHRNGDNVEFENIEIDSEGEILNWPDGFFDQYMNFTKKLMKKRIGID